MEIRTPFIRIIAFGFFAALMLAGTAQAAALYKWTDEEGNIHYSQTPPENREADKMQIKDTTPATAPDNAEEQGIPEEAKQDPQEIDARKRNCETARANLEVYKTSAKIQQPDGKVIVISDEMRKSKIEEAQKLIEVFCK